MTTPVGETVGLDTRCRQLDRRAACPALNGLRSRSGALRVIHRPRAIDDVGVNIVRVGLGHRRCGGIALADANDSIPCLLCEPPKTIAYQSRCTSAGI